MPFPDPQKVSWMLQKLWSRLRADPERPLPPSKPLQALLLQNDPIVASLLSDTLRAEGFHVQTARTAAEVSVQARRQAFDLIFLDCEGNPSALETIREIRYLVGPELLTVVAVLDPKARGDSSGLIAAGADDCFTKPLVLSEVRSRIQARLRGRGKGTATQEVAKASLGTVLDGKFRLEEKLGSGNFGTVYSARHLTLERQVAIKILHDKFSGREEVERRLRLEGVSTCQIEHPNAVKVLDLSLTRRGEPYLVMELLRGRSLDDELDAAPGGRLDPLRAAEILLPVCRVLSEIHSLGMLHLDIKPGNIFLHRHGEQETVKVLDFGIVRMTSEEDQGEGMEVYTKTFEGTPQYASVERLVGEPFGAKADVFSLGALLYQMLCGRLPFAAAKNPIHLVGLLTAGEYPPLPSLEPTVPADLAVLCERCLSTEAADRPTAGQVAEGLETWIAGGGTIH